MKEKSVEKLEVGKDYINKDGLVVIDRLGVSENRGFYGNSFVYDLLCSNPNEWREATEEEVIEAFEKHLPHRFGENWETMKIKEMHPSLTHVINDGSWNVDISKYFDDWIVWNVNGVIYTNGIWVERLEEPENKKIMKTSRQIIDEINQMNDGSIMEIYKVQGGFKTKFQSGWTPAPEDIEAMNKNEKEKGIMKQYRLKQWYPSLDNDFEVGDIVSFDRIRGCYVSTNNRDISLRKREVENNPDFWELIEERKPLFVTEEGVRMFYGDKYIIVDKEFRKIYMCASNPNVHPGIIRFYHEANADEYIWKNKPVFSYNDIKKLRSGGGGVFYDVAAIAKERVEEL